MTQNIEQRTLAAVNQYENASGTIDKFAHADEVVNTPVGAVKTFPKISKEWDTHSTNLQNKWTGDAAELTADWKAERDALSIKALPVLAWVQGEAETNINQQRRFTDGHTYLPKTVPALMNAEPDSNWIAYTADKSDVLSDVFGSKPVDLVNGLVISPVNNQYPKLAAFNAIYELADNSASYTVKSFAKSVGGDCVITLSDDSLLITKKVEALTQQKQWRSIGDVRSFGKLSSNDAAENTRILQAAFDYMLNAKVNIQGISGTFPVGDLHIGRGEGGGGFDETVVFNGNGMKLQPLKNTRLEISGKRVAVKNFSYLFAEGAELLFDYVWHSGNSNVMSDCPVRLAGGISQSFGNYWNVFTNPDFRKGIIFDVTKSAINQIKFSGGRVSGVTLTPFSQAEGTKEAYNNVFSGVDITGNVNWNTECGANNGSPLILDQCNLEGDIEVRGNVIRRGGATLPKFTKSIWSGDPSTTFTSDYQYNNRYKSYEPRYSENIQPNGDASTLPANIRGAYLTISKSPAIIGDRVFLWKPPIDSSFPKMYIDIPEKYMPLIKRIGYVTVSFYMLNVGGFQNIQIETDDGITQGGIIAPVPTDTDQTWCYQSITVKVKPSHTFARVVISAQGDGIAKQMQFDCIAIHIGDTALPYSRSAESSSSLYAVNKLANIDGNSITLFSLPTRGYSEVIEVTVSYLDKINNFSGISAANICYANALGLLRYGVTTTVKTNSGQGVLGDFSVQASGDNITVKLSNTAIQTTSMQNQNLLIELKSKRNFSEFVF